ncbi:SMI1/KNR4 family protein [Peribacillus sp. NPDC006672]|uniref:SMI1/KNR4 family protein n=1 Tax=Peribacillus sp. NPDC006672 TaxID=3390606 RepID=UPI003D0378A1
MFQHIWTHYVLDEHELDELTDEEIKRVEHLFKFKLPTSYIELMKIKNGGELEYRIFPCDSTIEDGELIVDFLYGISEKDGIGQTFYFVKEWGLPNDLILLSGDGHSWFALDYRGAEKIDPPVVYIDTEQNLDVKIAQNFTEFVDKLSKPEFEEVDDDKEDVYRLNVVYTKKDVENATTSVDVSDGLSFFSDNPCDINWFLQQVERGVSFIEEDDEINVYEILTSLMKKLNLTMVEDIPYLEVKRVLDRFKEYQGLDFDKTVQKAAYKIEKYLDKKIGLQGKGEK